MNLSYAQFQALSSCEAQQMHNKMGRIILQAYADGMSVILEHHDSPIEELLAAHTKIMKDLGFHDDVIPKILVKVLYQNVVKTGGI